MSEKNHGPRDGRARRDRASLDTLTLLANDLAGEFRLRPLLQRILRSAVQLLDCDSGSLYLIDQAKHSYRKEVDLEASCLVGTEFSLDEGVTGAVARAGAPVIFERYADVPRGHMSSDEPRYRHAVVGVPVRLRYDLIGALVVFASTDDRRFSDEDAQLLQRFATHAAIAIANSRLHAEAAERAKDAAVSAERERAMLEVHDTIGRSLATIMVRLGEARQASASGEDVTAALQRARAAVQEALAESQRAVRGIGDALQDSRPLDETIRLELDWTQATGGVATTFRAFGERQEIAREVATQLLRIVQESLANVVQHAEASQVRVGLVYGTEGVAVIVEDDGRGFDVQQGAPWQDPGGVGLSGLVTRAAQVGGRLHVDSTPGWGTRIRADLPYRVAPGHDSGGPRLRIVVSHAEPAVRAGLVRLLERAEPGVQVVAETATMAEAVDAVRLLRPAVVLVGQAGADEAATLASTDMAAAVVVLVDDPAAEHDIREWASAGVRGFVPRDADATALGRAVLAAARGDVLVSGGVLEQLGGLPSPAVGAQLTQREAEVRELLAQGLADKQIASRLGISVKTVEKHVGAVLRKQRVRSRTELLARL